MRRKSERATTKKGKASPEKKVDKVKRVRTRRTKQSTSSENESADDTSPVREVELVAQPDANPPQQVVKEDSPEESQDQVWQVKTAESSGEVGEIQKLKICLTRPPSTPERADRSPRSKRKHSRATSSSDTPSNEGVEERKKSKKSKKSREFKDESDKNQDSQGDEPETETEKSENEISQSTESSKQQTVDSDETPMSTTNEDAKAEEHDQSVESVTSEEVTQDKKDTHEEQTSKSSDADTTVGSPKDGDQETKSEVQDKKLDSQQSLSESQETQSEANTSEQEIQAKVNTEQEESHEPEHSPSDEKSEILELHADESKIESSELNNIEEICKRGDDKIKDKEIGVKEVSTKEEKTNSVSEETKYKRDKSIHDNNKTDVVESSKSVDKRARRMSTDFDKDREESKERYRNKELERSDSTHSVQDENAHNGPSAPIVVSRKRKWGSRPKVTTQKSITISTDVLKDIIPDVKPAEFEEVIEERKHHKRIELGDRIERPVLPKIVIDNTENVEMFKKEQEEKDKENVTREPLGTNRRISIVKENDNILTRPPSPPRHKQSNILYITNLVRPFTLPQLKNLLQRTGKIAENGFWIDRIKSKCFVKYENEDQAVETRHALHGVTWPVSNPKTLQVDFSTQEAFDKTKVNEETDGVPVSTIPGTVEDWLREQDMKRERGEVDKPWERKAAMREWDVGKNEKDKEKERPRRDERPMDKRRHRTPERSPEPAKKFKKKEEEAPAKLLDDLFRKTKTTPCIYWLPLSAETIAIKEEQRRQHVAEHERRLQELRRTHRRH